MLRVPTASPTPGAARDRPSASQGPPSLDRSHRPDPDRDRPAHGADGDVSFFSPASPTPGAPLDRPSASQIPQRQQNHRPDPETDRPARGADVAASSPRVPDARGAARPPLGVAGTSRETRSPARSRSPSAASRNAMPRLAIPTSSRRAARRTAAISRIDRRARSSATPTIPRRRRSCEFPPRPPTPGAARDRTSASQGPRLPLGDCHRPDPARDRPAHGADGAASSPRVPDARRAARPLLDGAGGSTTTGSPARSRPRSASSRR